MFLGIDVGTSGVKAVLVDERGRVGSQATAPLDASRPQPGWSEQAPAHWWRATNEAVLALPAEGRRAVRAAGLSGQMHGATLLDAKDEVLRPAILWNDGRSAAQCEAVVAREPRTHEITGNAVFPGFTAPKLAWVEAHEPDVFARIAKVLLPKDYVRLLMTGDHATDLSDASGTSWLDVGARAWSDAMLAATGMTRAQVPELFEGSEATGTLLADVARGWGMDAVPVAAGGGDNAAGAVGLGVARPGEAFLSLGTSGVLFVASERFTPNPASGVHAFCHALPGRWHEMTVMLSAASCLEWASRLTGRTPGALAEAAEAAGRMDGTALFLPYLSGERTPHNDPDARGALFGLDHDTGPAALGQAVLEGVALGLADGLAALHAPESVESFTVAGGGARSSYWGRILAAALGRPLVYREGGEVGPALGAAKLAMLAAGMDEAEVLAPPAETATMEPQADDIEVMDAKRERFGALYRQTRTLNA